MMCRLALALALVASANAYDFQNACPTHSRLIADTYVDMNSCKCDSGYEPYPFPNWGCYKVTPLKTCPPHSGATNGATQVTSIKECRCDEGWAPYHAEGQDPICVYAYVFHVHGRLWLQPYNADAFTYDEEKDFQKAMGAAIGQPAQDILPYSVKNVTDVQSDLENTRLGYAKVLLAENEKGELERYNGKPKSGASIGFAIRIRGTKQADGRSLVETLKNKDEVSTILAKWRQESDASGSFKLVTYTAMYVWALTAEFWHPAPSKEANEVCEHDFQCKSVEKAGTTMRTQLICKWDKSTGDKRCRPPFQWAPKQPTPPPTPIAPTAAPTPLPDGLHYRAKMEFQLTIHCQCDGVGAGSKSGPMCHSANGPLSYNEFHAGRRAALLAGVAQALAEPAQHLYIAKAEPLNVENFRGDHFMHTHMLKRGLAITIGMRVLGGQTALNDLKNLAAKAGKAEFASDISTYTSSQGWALTPECLSLDSESITKQVIADAQAHVTPAPTPVALPGSASYCGSGTLLAMHGEASFIYKQTKDIDALNAWMDNAVDGARKCITPHGANNKAAQDLVQRFAVTTDCTSWIQATDGSQETLNWYISKHVEDHKPVKEQEVLNKYTFNYTLYIDTANPKVAEDIVSSYFKQNNGDYVAKNFFQKAINKCSAGKDQNIKPFVTGDRDFDIADKPLLQSLTVKYTDMVTVNAAPTPAPTSKIDCEVTDWTSFTQCSKSCGGGTKTRFRMVITDGFGTGKHCKKSCEGEPTDTCVALHESESCNPGVCPTDCVMKQWGKWGDCSRTCGIGYKTRERQVKTPASVSPAGKACPTDPVTGQTWTKQSIKCTDKQFCPVDCQFSQWGQWSTCTKECGGGKRYHSRFAENQAMFGGEACAATMPCKDGITSDLTPPVTKDFGNATHPDVKQMCNAFYQAETCNENPCPQDCEVSGWSTWGSCSKTCAGKQPGVRLFGAKQERTRYVTKPDENGGQTCPGLTQTKLCSLHPCGAHVCTTNKGFPLTCTYENGIVYTHHVNEVHTGELFNCYFNYVTEVCTCLCWPRSVVSTSTHSGSSDVSNFMPSV